MMFPIKFTPPSRRPDMTGRLERRPDGTLLMVVTDMLGWRTTFVCTRGTAGYDVAGWVGEAPAEWRIAEVDDVPA